MAQAQGALSQVLLQMENTFKALPTNVKSKKVYIETCDIKLDQGMDSSAVLRGGTRHPTQGVRGNVDVGGGINTELQATTALLYAALGSMASSQTGGTMGTAFGAPTATIDAVNQLMTINQTTHGCSVGDSIEIAGLTAPTSLNSLVLPVVAVPTANQLIIRIPMGTTTTFTLGSGTIKRVTANGTTYTHTLKAGGNLASYVIEKGFTDITQYFRYLGCKCSSLSFGIGGAGLIKLATNWMGASESTASSSFDSAPLDNGKRSFDNLGIAAANILEGGSAVANILSIDSLTIDNDLDGDTFVVGGGGSRAGISGGIYKITGTLKAQFEDLTYYTKARNLTESSLDFTITRGTGAGTDNNESIQVVIPELVYKAASPPIEGPKGVVITLGFEGYYDNNADATGLKIILNNAIPPGALI